MSNKSIIEAYGFANTRGVIRNPTHTAFAKGNEFQAMLDRKADPNERRARVDRRVDPSAIAGKTGYSMSTYQVKIAVRMMSNMDTYIDLAPASGKTSPILMGFYVSMTKYLLNLERVPIVLTHGSRVTAVYVRKVLEGMKHNDLPRLMYIARTKQLASEGFVQTFRGDKDYGLIRIMLEHWKYFIDSSEWEAFATLNRKGIEIQRQAVRRGDPGAMPNVMPTLAEYVRGPRGRTNITNLSVKALRDLSSSYTKDILSMYDINLEHYQKFMRLINDEAIANNHGESSPKFTSKYFGMKPVVISTPSTGKNSKLVSLFKSNNHLYNSLILDESQQYAMQAGSDGMSKDNAEFARFYYDIVAACRKPGECGMQILTGTTNIKTSQLLADTFNKKLGRNFIIPNAAWVSSVQKDGITKEMEKLGRRAEGNRSNITVVPYGRMQQPEVLGSIIVNSVVNKEAGTLVIVFSSSSQADGGIINLVHKATQALPKRYDKEFTSGKSIHTVADVISFNTGDQLSKKQYADEFVYNEDGTSTTVGEVGDIEFLKYFSIEDALKSEGGRGVKHPDQDSILYRGVLAGVGFLIGGMDPRHKAIIQYLFRVGKIYCLLGTDAIGIGSNVLSKHMYLTSTVKPPTFHQIDKSSLLQMIHRIGRTPAKIPYAFVYVDPVDVEDIENLLNTDPSIAVEELDEGIIKHDISQSVTRTREYKEALKRIGSKVVSKVSGIGNRTKSVYDSISSWLG